MPNVDLVTLVKFLVGVAIVAAVITGVLAVADFAGSWYEGIFDLTHGFGWQETWYPAYAARWAFGIIGAQVPLAGFGTVLMSALTAIWLWRLYQWVK